MWLLFGRDVQSAATWSGTLTGPPSPPDLEPCQVQLRRLGRDVGIYKQRRHHFPETLDDFNPVPTCPWTGRPYAWRPAGQEAFLYCAGRQHGEANAPAFDFQKDDAVPTALMPPEGTEARQGWEEDARGLIPDRTAPFFAPFEARRHGEAYKAAASFLAEKGYGRPESGYAVVVAVVSARAAHDPELEAGAKSLLREALRKLPRLWPFPLVQMSNGELEPKPADAGQAAELKLFRERLQAAGG